MLGAIYVGLSGMEAYSKGLQTISNNVANLDTLGYKSSTISFSDLFGEGGNGLAYTSGQSGGSLGSGVRYNKETVDFTQGTLQQTGGALDLAIQGNGFLVVQNDLGDTFYTRTGQFSVNADGIVTNQSGDRLMVLNQAGQLKSVDLNSEGLNNQAPNATTKIDFTGNINTNSNTASAQPITVYDSTGTAHNWNVSFSLVSPPTNTNTTEWTIKVTEGNDSTSIGSGTVIFDSDTTFDKNLNSSDIVITTHPTNAKPLSVKLNFANATSGSSGSGELQLKQDGFTSGSLTAATVNAQGRLILTYSNKQTTDQGAVAIADFQNQQQLVRVGSGLFKNSGTGLLQYKASGADGIGTLQFGQVEASNVNLTAEFGNLILVQRGFDASSQVISASNDMIQQLFGMRGHG